MKLSSGMRQFLKQSNENSNKKNNEKKNSNENEASQIMKTAIIKIKCAVFEKAYIYIFRKKMC